MFLSLDGIDGVGKSTQMQLLVGWLRQQDRPVVVCRDPGSTPVGDAIRAILLGNHSWPIHPRSEMLLYMAARAQLVEQVIRPALEAGQTVVCDRYLLANVAYQGYGGKLDVQDVWQVGQVATGGLQPELTLLLDLPAEEAMGRIGRAPDRMESQGLEYLKRVRAGYLQEASRQPERTVVIDAAGTVEQVQARLRAVVQRWLK